MSKSAIRPGDQLFWGLVLGAGAMYGITSKSWQVAAVFVGGGVFLFLPMLAFRAFAQRNRTGRIVGGSLLLLFTVTLLWGVLALVERAYFMNGDTYPAVFAVRDLGVLNAQYPYMPEDKLKRLCGRENGPLMIYQKNSGIVAIRCGFDSLWPFSKTYIGHVEGK
ncbi:hypothetical protein KPB05_37375 [Burkholderia gladioli]|uniref:hypothetical protein n=1 Tax=Burkholderia gladioli TaxID=28095 RepID=UPI00285B32CD|nr:hypothetical protein [Burkholderia gladioli]MDR8093131.1 hypothetical protein [Burkholderia gladioli]